MANRPHIRAGQSAVNARPNLGWLCTAVVPWGYDRAMTHAFFVLDLRSSDRETRQHRHDYHQLVLPVAGELDMQIGPCEGRVHSSQAAIIIAGEAHAFTAAANNRFVVADIPVALAPLLARIQHRP